MFSSELSSSSDYAFLTIKFFLLFSGFTIFFFSLLSFLIPLGLGNLIFPLLFYSLLKDFYFVFFGLFWTPFHYYFFIDIGLFNFLLLIFSSVQLLFVYYYSLHGFFPKFLASFFLICNLSFIPFGLISLFFLNTVQYLNQQPKESSKTNIVFDPNSMLQKFSLFFILGLILNYSVAFSVLNITRVFVIQADFFSNGLFLFLMIVSLLVAFLVFCSIGSSLYDLKKFYLFSLGSNLLAFITYYSVNFILSASYPDIKNQIEYLAPSSILLVASCIFFGWFYKMFISPSKEVSSA